MMFNNHIKQMIIKINSMLTGNIIFLDVKQSLTVLDLKKMLQDQTNWPLDLQSLICASKYLQDE